LPPLQVLIEVVKPQDDMFIVFQEFSNPGCVVIF
jgi:hypothetical protein